MTRKDYVAIAGILKEQVIAADAIYNEAHNADLRARGLLLRSRLTETARKIAVHFEFDNAAFDRARFLKACGLSA